MLLEVLVEQDAPPVLWIHFGELRRVASTVIASPPAGCGTDHRNCMSETGVKEKNPNLGIKEQFFW